jgi:predicted transcriptional regulator
MRTTKLTPTDLHLREILPYHVIRQSITSSYTVEETNFMATRQTMTVSLPPAMMREVDRIRRKEGRTRSELIREALRHYSRIDQFPAYKPTARELEEIKKGREEIKRGEYFTLDEIRTRLLGSPRKKVRTKKSSTRAKA